jgi:magnesium transporter
VIDYDADGVRETRDAHVEDCLVLRKPSTITWVRVDGVHDASIVEAVGNVAGLHPLVMEDIVNTSQRPKYDVYDGYGFIELYMLYDRAEGVEVEQVSLILGAGYVLTFQEVDGGVFAPVIDRIKSGKGNIRKYGADYLAYVIVDTIVDHYFHVLESLGERIDAIEAGLLARSGSEALVTINEAKRDILHLRRAIWPVREVLSEMERNEDRLFAEETRVYLRDVYDHVVQVIELLETQRDFLASLTDLYLSSQSQRMNEVMRFLTVVGTIFIPLTFIVGLYGMNFADMPELHWRYGYPAVLGIMAVIGIGMVFYFKKRRWL